MRILTLEFGKAEERVLNNLDKVNISQVPLIKMGKLSLDDLSEPELELVMEESNVELLPLAPTIRELILSSHSLVNPKKKWVKFLKASVVSTISALIAATCKINKRLIL